eukprot:scpid107684/ scgid21358/ 
MQAFPGIWSHFSVTTMNDFLILQTNQQDTTIGDKDSSLFATFALSCNHRALYTAVQCTKKKKEKTAEKVGRHQPPAQPTAPAVMALPCESIPNAHLVHTTRSTSE